MFSYLSIASRFFLRNGTFFYRPVSLQHRKYPYHQLIFRPNIFSPSQQVLNASTIVKSNQNQSRRDKELPTTILFIGACLVLGGSCLKKFVAEEKKSNNLEEYLSSSTESSVLDLRSYTLTNEDFQTLWNWLSNKPHSFMRILWEEQNAQLASSFIEKINEVIKQKQDSFEERPSPYDCAQFCQFAYSPEAYLKQEGKLLPEWKVLKACDNTQKDGYFGVSFINHKTRQIILAHRGTEPGGLFHDLQADILGIVGGAIERQQDSAIQFTYQTLKEAEKYGYRVGIVGHSLGGWLAQLTGCLATSKGYQGIYVFTIDTPGARKMVETYFKAQSAISMLHIEQDNLDFTHYLSLPNPVNTCGPQTGDLFHIVPNFAAMPLTKRVVVFPVMDLFPYNTGMPLFSYILKTHSLNGLLASFDPQQETPKRFYKVLSWPEFEEMGIHYDEFFRVMSKNIRSLPDVTQLSDFKQYLIKHVAHYDIVEGNQNVLDVRHLPTGSIELLQRIRERNQEDPQFLATLEKRMGLQENTLSSFLSCEIKDKHLSVTPPFETPGKFRKAFAKLLAAHPELPFYIFDKNLKLAPEELQSICENTPKMLINLCENIIPSRLYLYNKASAEELVKDQRTLISLSHRIRVLTDLQNRLENENTYTCDHINKRLNDLKVAQSVVQALFHYKSRDFEKAASSIQSALELIQTLPLASESSMNHLAKGALYSLKAKLFRSKWTTREDLEESARCYTQATKELPEVASLWSNYDALLNNYAEWLSWEANHDEALHKHREALQKHKEAHTLSLKGHWLFQEYPVTKEDINRNYGRALFLIAQEESKQQLINEEQYQKKLREALVFFSSEITSPTTYLFKGIILQELRELDKALECYESGLKKASTHVTLLYRKATIYSEKGNREVALKYATQSKEECEKRGICTPEDSYRLKLINNLIENINNA